MVYWYFRYGAIISCCFGVALLVISAAQGWKFDVDPLSALFSLKQIGGFGVLMWIVSGLTLIYVENRVNPKYRIFVRIAGWWALMRPLLCLGDMLLIPGTSVSAGFLLAYSGSVIFMATIQPVSLRTKPST